MPRLSLSGGAYQARSVIASAQRYCMDCGTSSNAYTARYARASRSNRPGIRPTDRNCTRHIANGTRRAIPTTILDLPVRVRCLCVSAEHDADFWSYRVVRVPSLRLHRPDRPEIRRLDGAGSLSQKGTAHTLALSLCMRDRAGSFWFQSYQWQSYSLHGQAGSHWQDIRQMDRAWPRQEKAAHTVLAMPLRVWDPARRCVLQLKHRHFGVVRLHHRHWKQEAVYPAWSGKRQNVLGLGFDAAEVQQPQQQRLWQIRRPRNTGLARLGYFRGLRAGYGTDLRSGSDARSDRRERQLLPGQLHVGAAVGASRESTPFFGVEASCPA